VFPAGVLPPRCLGSRCWRNRLHYARNRSRSAGAAAAHWPVSRPYWPLHTLLYRFVTPLPRRALLGSCSSLAGLAPRTRDALAGSRACCRGRTWLPSRCCGERCCCRPVVTVLAKAPRGSIVAVQCSAALSCCLATADAQSGSSRAETASQSRSHAVSLFRCSRCTRWTSSCASLCRTSPCAVPALDIRPCCNCCRPRLCCSCWTASCWCALPDIHSCCCPPDIQPVLALLAPQPCCTRWTSGFAVTLSQIQDLAVLPHSLFSLTLLGPRPCCYPLDSSVSASLTGPPVCHHTAGPLVRRRSAGPQTVGTPAGPPVGASLYWTPSSSSPPSSILLCSAFAGPPVHHRAAGTSDTASLTLDPSWQFHAILPTFLLCSFVGMSSVVVPRWMSCFAHSPPAMLVLLRSAGCPPAVALGSALALLVTGHRSPQSRWFVTATAPLFGPQTTILSHHRGWGSACGSVGAVN
jgi:hypothetical protein